MGELTPLDRLVVGFDRGLRALAGEPRSQRPSPGTDVPEAELNEAERRHAAALMRVNHCGEICAQALYQGQALASRIAVPPRESILSSADFNSSRLAAKSPGVSR